jgi:HEXXH motif-containing protein
VITDHRLPAAVFDSLAQGDGDAGAMLRICRIQRDKHLTLLAGIISSAAACDDEHEVTAFMAACELRDQVLMGKDADSWLFGLPHMGAWIHDCQLKSETASSPDLGYFACLVAAAAVRVGFRFELEVPVRDGRILLPGLGSMEISSETDWITMRCDGRQVTAGDQFQAHWRHLVPDNGRRTHVPHWSGTPVLQATAGMLTWDVLLETRDKYLDCFTHQMWMDLPASQLRNWRHRFQLAWMILVEHHRWAAEPMADTISAIVPLWLESENDLVSATTPAAFGAIATSWPPDPVTMAETLVHEFQHVKLGGLMDMVPLVKSTKNRGSAEKSVYAPWRLDPRPAGSLLQGAYAFLGIMRFWGAQRKAELDPDSILRAQAQFTLWRMSIECAFRTMIRARCLTPTGLRFVRQLYAWERDLIYDPIPLDAQEMAAEAALDHQLTWQLKHVGIEAAGVQRLAAAYLRNEAYSAQAPPATWIGRDIRILSQTADNRSRLLTTRFLAPARFRELCQKGKILADEADVFLVGRKTRLAIKGYREQITRSPEQRPEAWIGLALALHQLAESPFKPAFGARITLLFDLYYCLSAQGERRDPLELARWLR